jgi:hypothetical protein
VLAATQQNPGRNSTCRRRRSRKRMGKRERLRLCRECLSKFATVSFPSPASGRLPTAVVSAQNPQSLESSPTNFSATFLGPSLEDWYMDDVIYLLFPELSPISMENFGFQRTPIIVQPDYCVD